jgi:hypothetical protein
MSDYEVRVDFFGLSQLSFKELCIVGLVVWTLFCGLLGFMTYMARNQCAEYGGRYCEPTQEVYKEEK